MPERAVATTKKPEAKQKCSNSCKQNVGFNSSGPTADMILQLQRTAGNRAVQKLIKSGALQAKLRIGQPNDIYEQEADRVAEQVMRMPDPTLQKQIKPEEEKDEIIQTKSSVNHITSLVQRQNEEEIEEEPIQRKENDHLSEVSSEVHTKIRSLQGEGQPLTRASREFFEPRFGYDFSEVRVHTGTKAMESAKAVNALAYTVGKDIVFGTGQLTMDANEGKRLLAHELTHVIQQNNPNKQSVPVKGVSSSEVIQRYLSPLDILDYIGLGIDVGERIYLAHFYEGNDRDFQLALNLIYTAIDGVMAILPGVGGGGLAARASHGALALAWSALPASAQSKVVDEVAKGMSWTAIKTVQFINHLMRGEGGEKGGSKESKKQGGSERSGITHQEQRAKWQQRAKEWFKENNVISTGQRDDNTGKLVYRNQEAGNNRRYYTIDEWHGQIEIFDHKYKHIGFMDINRGQSFFGGVPGRRLSM